MYIIIKETDLKFEVVFDKLESHVGDISLEEATRAQHQYFLYQCWKESLQNTMKLFSFHSKFKLWQNT